MGEDQEGDDEDISEDEDQEGGDEDISPDEDQDMDQDEEDDDDSNFETHDDEGARIPETGGMMDPEDKEIAQSQEHSRLLELPRELRDDIYKLVLKVEAPLSDREFHFKCPSIACVQKPGANYRTWRSQFDQARAVLATCKQIHNEGTKMFFEVNSWTVHRPRMRDNEAATAPTLVEDTLKTFCRYGPGGRKSYVRFFQHLNMRIAISPLATVDLGTPNQLDTTDLAELLQLRVNQDPEVLRRHTLPEATQCLMFQIALDCLASNQSSMFPWLRSFTLEMGLHSPVFRPIRDPLDRCGQTFKLIIKLGKQTSTNDATKETTSKPVDMYEGWDTNLPMLEPRRRMLAPLMKLKNVQSVEVHRIWTVRYKKAKKGSQDGPFDHRMGQHVGFDSVSRFLHHAGPNFENFLVTGLEYFKIPVKDLIEIIEDQDQEGRCDWVCETGGNRAEKEEKGYWYGTG